MRPEWLFVTVWIIMVILLVTEVTLAVSWNILGAVSTIGVMSIAAVQALFAFLYFMYGKYGGKSIAVFMVISMMTLIPLFIALMLSVEFPRHAVAE